jgi:outer membrane receptor protein involved in Fe transport
LRPSDRLLLGFSYFDAKHNDPIFPRQRDQCVSPAPGVPPGVNQFCNVFPPPQYSGYTLTADWAFAQGWTAGGSYTFTDPETVQGTLNGTLRTATYTFHSNRHLAKLLLSYAGERLSLGLDVTRAEGRFWGDNFSNPVTNYSVFNARANYRLDRHWTLLATFFNLFDEDYATRADRAVIGGVERFAGIPQPKSHAMLGVSYGF